MQILPKEMIDLSIEPYTNRIRVKSKIIYLLTLALTASALASLPLLYVDINVSGNGIIRPDQQRAEIYAQVSGKAENLFISDNQVVGEGETLLSILPDLLLQREQSLMDRVEYFDTHLNDLQLYIRSVENDQTGQKKPFFNSSYYASMLMNYQEKRKNLEFKIEAEKRIFERNKILYEQKVISLSEFENFENELNTLLAQGEIDKQNQISEREAEKKQLIDQRNQLKSELSEIDKEKQRYVIKAPVGGTIINMMKVHDGSFISANQLIGEISPNSKMIVECYISPSDIGLLHVGQEVRFTVDAFNYNEWGFLEGTIYEVAQDISFSEHDAKPYFTVKCELATDYLMLKNGHRGQLKKGMTVSGRFLVARRNLYQLLFDKADDWVNPSKS